MRSSGKNTEHACLSQHKNNNKKKTIFLRHDRLTFTPLKVINVCQGCTVAVCETPFDCTLWWTRKHDMSFGAPLVCFLKEAVQS
mmetsp:Transcript_10403/g.11853  ORF Transcript_10403/g.11853 Transcript_10403/m.11853 type:complete len:84 (+) Transcript_10403:249-500(+)